MLLNPVLCSQCASPVCHCVQVIASFSLSVIAELKIDLKSVVQTG